ncbi:hypothetical protein Mapa_000272 [Marchantia paleacea]|nr:hypothetical protein Mapa_000272 [Marchantia paleacea]
MVKDATRQRVLLPRCVAEISSHDMVLVLRKDVGIQLLHTKDLVSRMTRWHVMRLHTRTSPQAS